MTPKGSNILTIFIIVAIIAIIVAIAIPAWQSNRTRSRVAAALDAASAAKLVVMEAATVNQGHLDDIKSSALAYNASVTSPYVASVTIGDGGLITVTTKNTGANPDPVLLLTPQPGANQSPFKWICTVVSGDAAHMPDTCSAARAARATPAATAPGPATAASVRTHAQ